MSNMTMKEIAFGIVTVTAAVAVVLGVLWGILWGWQYFKVFKATYTGKAILAEAEYSRQVAVKEAQARKDSAVLLAEAEVYRAEGVAKANKIIADGLGGPDGYISPLPLHSHARAEPRQAGHLHPDRSRPPYSRGGKKVNFLPEKEKTPLLWVSDSLRRSSQ
jgi:hypothetical protein